MAKPSVTQLRALACKIRQELIDNRKKAQSEIKKGKTYLDFVAKIKNSKKAKELQLAANIMKKYEVNEYRIKDVTCEIESDIKEATLKAFPILHERSFDVDDILNELLVQTITSDNLVTVTRSVKARFAN